MNQTDTQAVALAKEYLHEIDLKPNTGEREYQGSELARKIIDQAEGKG